ncbi:MAG: acetoacetate decarboxylase family protein [Polyangiaceae bacterium]|nr:acetoacetate decarboxylase family protein [Polyangiaceae bacterium]
MKADLPIIYRRSFAVFAAFPCPMRALRELLPQPLLAPIKLGFGKGVLVVAAFDYEDTSIGPYREVGIGFQCRLRRSGPLPIVPLFAERFFDDVGTWVHFLPVTTQQAHDAGREHWGFPKIVGDIRIDRSADSITCEVSQNGEKLLHFSADRPGRSKAMGVPMRFYSQKEDEVLFTELHIDAVGATTRIGARARLDIADSVYTRDLDREALAKSKPLEVRWFDEYRTMLDRPSIRYRASA